jgi:hypothetical protein
MHKIRHNKWESVVFRILVGMIRMALSLSSIMPIMDVAYEVNDSTYQDGERMPNGLLRSSRLTSDNVYGTYIQIVLIVTLMISKVLDSEKINTTFVAVLWNRNRKGI